MYSALATGGARSFSSMADSSEDELLLLDSVLPKIILGKRKRVGVHDINQRRRMESEYHKLFPLLKRSPSRFHSYLRMSQETFKYILERIEPKITKNWCNLHQQPARGASSYYTQALAREKELAVDS